MGKQMKLLKALKQGFWWNRLAATINCDFSALITPDQGNDVLAMNFNPMLWF
jgi:hypothetical protein